MVLFTDTKMAFAAKSDAEIKKAYMLFRFMQYNRLMRFVGHFALQCLRLRLPIKGLIRRTIFSQFCGGVSIQSCLPVINHLDNYKVKTVLDYSIEDNHSDADFEDTVSVIIATMTFSKSVAGITFSVFKPSAISNSKLYTKISAKEILSEEENLQWKRTCERFDCLCGYAAKMDIPILIDAEESWMQQAVDDICIKMMRRYNIEKTIVYNTAQMYRHDRLKVLETWYDNASKEGYKVGVKLVRGAYIDKENERAKQLNYPSPICKNKAATDTNFDKALTYLMTHIDIFRVFIGSHNEHSCKATIKLMDKYSIPKNSDKVWISQLYGMSDHISFNLANEGYQIIKYMPFGPVHRVIPYLIRRAEENRSFDEHSTRESQLLKTEIVRRRL